MTFINSNIVLDEIMKFVELPFGMYGWANKDIGFFGGIRADGFHKSGHMRCLFDVYDIEARMRTGVDRQIGQVTMNIKLAETEEGRPEIVELIKLEINKDLRGQGLGRRSVEALLEAVHGDLKVGDMKKSKLSFWKKMGVVGMTTGKSQVDGYIPNNKAVDMELEVEMDNHPAP